MSGSQKTPVGTYDAIVIGAGISGMYQLHALRKLGLSVRVFEAGSDVGGTWYWNRYPGARFDSESWTYGYSFDEEILQEWDWTEHFSPQPETLRYCNFVADKLDLRRDITFDSRVQSATWHEDDRQWEIATEDGVRARVRFLITALGPLSAPTWPNIPGIDEFEGEAYHTARWPHEPVTFDGKRIGVIGTGATAIQAIAEIAKTAGHLTVFQRTANWAAPLHNSPIDDDTQADIKSRYTEILAKCRENFGGFIHDPDPRNTLDVNPEEREALWEELYASPGFGIWMGNFRDTLIDAAANAEMTKFMARKIRERVRDPATAEKLIPMDHGFGTRRLPLESGYYEVYNQDNVDLVNVRETPIERITARGIETSGGAYELDMIVYATGFDPITGGFERIDIRGAGGQTLKAKWVNGAKTYFGLAVAGFPNLLMCAGPQGATIFCNMPRCIEQNVDWITDLIRYTREKGYERVEATESAEEAWTGHVYDVANRFLFSKVDSWMTGVNRNLANKQKRTVPVYAGGAPFYRERSEDVAAHGYLGFELT